jgi:hypothetical protein
MLHRNLFLSGVVSRGVKPYTEPNIILTESTAQIQKVSAQLEVGKFATGRIRGGGSAPQVVNNP